MIDDNVYKKFSGEQKHRHIFSGWIIANIALASMALYSALIPPSLPDCSLILYGFAAICAWQMLPYLDLMVIKRLKINNGKNTITGWLVILLACFSLYVGCVSAVSTFSMFPHPDILARFSLHIVPVQIPTMVFLPALLVFCRVAYRGCILLRGVLDNNMSLLAKKQGQRESLATRWLEKIRQMQQPEISREDALKELREIEGTKTFGISWIRFLSRRVFSFWVFLLAIPVWSFISIPLKNFPSLSAMPVLFLSGMVVTAGLVGIWSTNIVIGFSREFRLNKRGIIRKGIFRENGLFWHRIKSLYLCEGILLVDDLQGKRWKIFFKDMEEPEKLWMELLAYMPLEILLIAENGWKYASKMISPENFDHFLAKYQNAWSEKREEKKKKKKGKKNK